MGQSFVQHRLAADRLNLLVRSVWSLSYDADAALTGVIAPDGQVEFVFQTGTPCALAHSRAGWSDTPRAMVFALRHGTLRMEPRGGNHMLAFRVSPAVASVILRRGLADCWDRPVVLRDLIGGEADLLLERIAGAPPETARETIERWLLGRLSDWSAEDARNLVLQRLLLAGAVQRPVSGLADALGVTDRTLRRHCARYAGVSPKQLAMTGRMLRACALLRHCPSMPLVEVADRLGFNDQAAFTNAFRHHVGTTPAKLRAEPLVYCELP